MLHRKKMNEYSLDDWMVEFNEIYGAVNEKRSIESIWLHGVEHASQLHEDLRIGEYENAFGHIADLMCWLCAFTSKTHSELGTSGSLHDIVLNKYPGICFYCSNDRCICSATIGRGIEDQGTKERLFEEGCRRARIERDRLHHEGTEPKSLQDIVEMFCDIYEHINFRTPLEVIMAHLQEEVGEVATCLNDFVDKPPADHSTQRRYQLKLEHEIADIVTWTVALFQKLDYLLAAGRIYLVETGKIAEPAVAAPGLTRRSLGITLPATLWRHFQSPDGNTLWCPSCQTRPCRLRLP